MYLAPPPTRLFFRRPVVVPFAVLWGLFVSLFVGYAPGMSVWRFLVTGFLVVALAGHKETENVSLH